MSSIVATAADVDARWQGESQKGQIEIVHCLGSNS